MIRITDLRHRLLDVPPDLAVDARHIAVIGPNGSGKTTLLSVCSGIEAPEAGSVRLLGRPPSAVKVGWVGEFPPRPDAPLLPGSTTRSRRRPPGSVTSPPAPPKRTGWSGRPREWSASRTSSARRSRPSLAGRRRSSRW
ncbi:ATP-binding cassette domain-containing protein, partial [Methanoculleus chikugoensis]|uniref:ATP-binding cassette domain-containing protein n=1 Tax=Methanoculleus chikugoensis TaxID=118126 RepID=UPI001FB1EAB8